MAGPGSEYLKSSLALNDDEGNEPNGYVDAKSLSEGGRCRPRTEDGC